MNSNAIKKKFTIKTECSGLLRVIFPSQDNTKGFKNYINTLQASQPSKPGSVIDSGFPCCLLLQIPLRRDSCVLFCFLSTHILFKPLLCATIGTRCLGQNDEQNRLCPSSHGVHKLHEKEANIHKCNYRLTQVS